MPRLLVTSCALALGAAVLAAAPAVAHDETGVMVGEYVADPVDSPTGTYRIRLTYAGDGHPADGATVTLVAVSDAGATIAPTPLTPVDTGEYEAAVTFPSPGTWTVTVAATNPEASFGQTLTIAAPRENAGAENGAAEEVDDEPIAGSADADGDDGIGAGLWIGLLVVLVAAAVVVAVVVARRRARAV